MLNLVYRHLGVLPPGHSNVGVLRVSYALGRRLKTRVALDPNSWLNICGLLSKMFGRPARESVLSALHQRSLPSFVDAFLLTSSGSDRARRGSQS